MKQISLFKIAALAFVVTAGTASFSLAETTTPASNAATDLAEPVLKADRDFARVAGQEGAGKAFEAYLATGAVSPMAEMEQPADRATIIARMTKLDERGLKLQWSPLRGDLASSGDFGYTYGKWSVVQKDGGETLLHGFYTTIWKKQADGAWKAEFDMGNESPSTSN